MFLVNNPTYHAKIEHILVIYHFIRDMVEDKKVLLEKFDTLKNDANSLMKCVNTEKFSWCRESMGLAASSNWFYPTPPLRSIQQVGYYWICVVFFH
jgi:hypothetical protein